MGTTCRSCRRKDGLINLFETAYNGTLFSDIFNTFFAKIDESDNLPKMICNVCALSFMQFWSLKEQIVRSQKLLQLPLGEAKQGEMTDNIITDSDYSEKENQVPETKGSINLYKTQNIDDHGIKNEGVIVYDRDKRTLYLKDISEVNESNISELNGREYTCKYCEEKFYTRSTYMNHLNKEKRMRCPKTICHICSKEVTTSRFKYHVLAHSENKVYSCNICGMKISRKENISRHKYTHTITKPHMCHICGKGFIQAPSLADHLRAHNALEPLVCQFCGQTFTTRTAFQRHLKMHEMNPDADCKAIRKKNVKNRNYICGYCQKQWSTKQSLIIHIRSHTGERPYTCSFCGKKFTQKQHLTGHVGLHKGEKPFSCSYCGKCFTLKRSLTRHIMIHTGEKPHCCNVCPKKFCTSTNLKKHKRIHDVK